MVETVLGTTSGGGSILRLSVRLWKPMFPEYLSFGRRVDEGGLIPEGSRS